MKRIKVLIPFYKEKEKLDKCVKSLSESVCPYEVEILDDSETGNGFVKTVNKMLISSLNDSFEYFLILNQDCYLNKESVSEMIKFMDEHPRCAFGGVKQISEDGDRITHGGTGSCFPVGVHETGLVSKGDCSKNKRVPWVNGACFIARVSAIREIGIMDPNFFMFGSDSDWSYRSRLFGWECWFIANAICTHEQNISKSVKKEDQRILENDMRYFRDKWLIGESFKDLSLEVF